MTEPKDKYAEPPTEGSTFADKPADDEETANEAIPGEVDEDEEQEETTDDAEPESEQPE